MTDDFTTKLAGTGGVYNLDARWSIQAELRLVTPALLGGSEESATDMAVLRDSVDPAQALLPGSTQAGALRNHLADVLGGYGSEEHGDVALIFGHGRGVDDGPQSILIPFDAFASIEGGTELRDGVAIDPALGTAEPNKKFDFELLPAGTTFGVRYDVLIPSGSDEATILSTVCAALDGFRSEDIKLGTRRSKGWGEVSTSNWRARRFDYANETGWREWIADKGDPNAAGTAFSSVLDAVNHVASTAVPLPVDQRSRVVVTLHHEIKHGLIIRAYPSGAGEPDMVHLKTNQGPIVSGSSLGGALRLQATRIARWIRPDRKDADRFVERLFGPRPTGTGRMEDDGLFASRVRVSERPIVGSEPARITHVAIDRFTGGALNRALYEEQPVFGGTFKVRLELRFPADADEDQQQRNVRVEEETGLFVLLVKDFVDGMIGLGGMNGIGRGTLNRVAAELVPHRHPTIDTTIKLDVNSEPDPAISHAIEAAWTRS